MHPIRAVAVTGTALAVAAAGPLLIQAQAATPESLSIATAGTQGAVVSDDGQFTVTGDTTVDVSVAHLSDGQARIAAGPGGGLPRAIDFPSYVDSGTYPRAVVRVDPTSGLALSPGSSDFEYGAVFRLDAVNEGRAEDNGNNAFQRGLSGQPAMFKLEVDDDRPACKVKGETGTAIVRSNVTVAPGAWYTATCSRVAGELTISVASYADTGPQAISLKTVTATTGDVTFDDDVSASIGGKLYRTGAIADDASDQFNGSIARVWVDRP